MTDLHVYLLVIVAAAVVEVAGVWLVLRYWERHP